MLYVAALLVQYLLCLLFGRRRGVRMRERILFGAAFALGMLVGAKLLCNLCAGSFTFAALLSPAHYTARGLWGGPLVYLALAVMTARFHGDKPRRALDLSVLELPASLMISKVACFLNGCCYGSPSSVP